MWWAQRFHGLLFWSRPVFCLPGCDFQQCCTLFDGFDSDGAVNTTRVIELLS